MANTFFQFKQFTVQQSEAALKVCTESCLFGASIPTGNAQRILDIGTGTGVLALMLAQRSAGAIEAIELDEASARDAYKNFQASPWAERLTLHTGDVKAFDTTEKFDLLISNPPFFIHQLKSQDLRTNAALHGSELKPEDLVDIVNRLSSEQGRFFVLLPEQELLLLRRQMEASGWELIYELSIYQQAGKKVFRKIGGFCRVKGQAVVCEELIIYKEDRKYTEAFIARLKDYYLYL